MMESVEKLKKEQQWVCVLEIENSNSRGTTTDVTEKRLVIDKEITYDTRILK